MTGREKSTLQKQALEDEALVQALSDQARGLADASSAGQPPPGAWHRLQARRQATGVARVRRWTLAASLATIVIGAVAWQGWRRANRPLTYEVAGGTTEEAGYVRGDTQDGARLAFSDGTRVNLAPGATLSVGAPGPHGARLRVQEGRAHFEVVHRPHAAWTVEAGPYLVEVTGTVFDVRWSGADEIAEVRLRAGSVRVSGPLLTEHATLRPGQSLVARLAAHELRIEDEGAHNQARPPERTAAPSRPPTSGPPPAAASAESVAAPPMAEPAAAPSPAADERDRSTAAAEPSRKPARRKRVRRLASATPPPAAPVPGWAPAGWTARVVAGDAQAVLNEAEARGLDSVLNEADAPALVALADAARYGRRPELAARVLLAQRHRFPGTPPAGNAAFFLGRLADDGGKPTEALDWYRRYLAEQPNGGYAAEALGRAMLGVARVSGRAAARDMAEEYLDRFPNGTYLLHARQILATP